MSGQTNRESDKFMLRLPDGMRERIKTAADLNQRSMNAEIVATLREAYPDPDPDEETRAFVAFFEGLPDEEKARFFGEYLSKLPEKDIEDGLIPGVRLRKE